VTADEIAKALPATQQRKAIKLDETSAAATVDGRVLLTAVFSKEDAKILTAALKDKARRNVTIPTGLLSDISVRDSLDGYIHLAYKFKDVPTEVEVREHQAALITVPDATSPNQVRFYLLCLE
jgi:hypothetical protein